MPAAHVAGALTALMVMTLHAIECTPQAELPGTWAEFRMTQFGPAWVVVTFGCDCNYDAHIQLFWFHFRNRSGYAAEGNAIRLLGKQGEMLWPYEIHGNQLLMHEQRTLYTYRRVSSSSCATARISSRIRNR